MSGPDLLVALTPVVEVLERLGVAHYVAGSVASSAYGIARTTLDVDLVAELRSEHVRPLIDDLQAAYYVDEGRVREAVAERRSFNLIHLGTMLKIDVFVTKSRVYDLEAQRRVRRDTLEDAEGARFFYLASPEDVVLAKLEWYRAGCETSDRQWTDVIGVIKTMGPTLDRIYLRHWADSLGVVDLLGRALTEAES